MTYSCSIGKNDYFVREAPLPDHIRGATMDDEDGNHNIYIKAGLSEEQRIRTLLHEVEHNEKGHLADDITSVIVKESEARKNDPVCGNRQDLQRLNEMG